jgi:2',3'-cyclic-nucleotide 2'-phosphodiesterase (5'-nucleotidase family)
MLLYFFVGEYNKSSIHLFVGNDYFAAWIEKFKITLYLPLVPKPSMNRAILTLYAALALCLFACTTRYVPRSIEYSGYRVQGAQKQDSSLLKLLKPYSDKINSTMNEVMGRTSVALEKKQPEGTLGNLMADAVLNRSQARFGVKVDGATLNNGGIRINMIPAGNITRGKVYELMPFDNIIVLLQMDGRLLQELLDHIAGRGGWPLAGITMQISNKKAVEVRVGGLALDPTATYTIALPDYVANGGDDCAMLRNIPQQNKGYLFRDALLEYIALQSQDGKAITATLENRVTHVSQ